MTPETMTMTPTAIIRKAQFDGVRLALSPGGKIRVTGDGGSVNRWLKVIKGHRPEIVKALQYQGVEDPTIEAARLTITSAAIRAGLRPIDVWGWLSCDDLTWIGSGKAEALEALQAYCEYWAQYGSQTSGNHEIPYHREVL